MVFDLQKKPYCKEVSSFWKRNFALFDYIATFFLKKAVLAKISFASDKVDFV